ncbi:MAG: shikimate 5-dehydrogenase, partial [Kluyvera intermedia]
TGFNTDYIAVKNLISSHQLDSGARVMIRGSGGMGKAVIAAFRDAGFDDVIIAARNEANGTALAQQYGFKWQALPEATDIDILVNVTPVGMAGGKESEELAYSEAMVERASVVFDVVALPPDTPVIKLAQRLGKKTISGAEVIAIQAVEQFVMYTGVRPDNALVAEAAAFARAG